jgi:hypothetical protein
MEPTMSELNQTLVLANEGSTTRAIIYVAICLLSVFGLALTFAKAGKRSWGAFIPIYNVIILLQIARRPLWWIILSLVPVVNVIVLVVVSVDIARAFGKGPGFGWGLAFLGFIFFPILGFGGASYEPTGSREKIADLGVSVVNNYLGRGINVGFGRGSSISDVQLESLIPLGLNELYFSRTEISDESLAHFEAMDQLRVLDLSNTNVSQDGIRQLTESLPHAKIIG